MKLIRKDPVIDEIREIRHRISERFGHDSEKLVAHYIKLQKKYKKRLLKEESLAKPRPKRQRKNGKKITTPE
jgi:hypothetical protein